MFTVLEVATRLANAHRTEDPKTTAIYLAEARDEVRLVEVTGSVAEAAKNEVLPFRFAPRPEQGIPFPVVVILLSQQEWESLGRKELMLPTGWENLKLVA